MRWAEEGLRTFEDDRSDTRLALFAADLLVKADRRSEAEAVLKRAFERAPALDVYVRWREAGGEAIRDSGARAGRAPGGGRDRTLFPLCRRPQRQNPDAREAVRHGLGDHAKASRLAGGQATNSRAKARRTIRARLSRSTRCASTSSRTAAPIALTRRRPASSPAWAACATRPNRRAISQPSRRAWPQAQFHEIAGLTQVEAARRAGRAPVAPP